ncbi:MAG: hypothetical protein O7F12_05670 [Nitrospirae bacterium]|nr:hypothetical protein [Nitrospirota bacterium]
MSEQTKKDTRFKTFWYHRKLRYWLHKHPSRSLGDREEPERIRLEVESGYEPNEKPPIRIFVGTETEQFRAERVFVWSIKQVRDPSRIYEIYLMKNLKGFDRTEWKTGFAHYRYAIPTLAGERGRAIYNDVDQVYLSDPAELFDSDMEGASMLAISPRETSVMLIDCEKMKNHWTRDDLYSGKKHPYFQDIVVSQNLWKPLAREWNSRDWDAPVSEAKCWHLTTIHTQPWKPFPDQLRYAPHPDGEVWLRMEHDADEAGFMLFSKEKPSRRFGELLDLYRILHKEGEASSGLPPEKTFDGRMLRRNIGPIQLLIQKTWSKTVLEYGSGKGQFYEPYEDESLKGRYRSHPAWPGVKVICYDPGYEPFAEPYEGSADGVISMDVLEHIPEEDIAWVLNEIFRSANRFVYVVAACYPAEKILRNGENAHCTLESPEWWRGQVELIARCYPDIHWVLICDQKRVIGNRCLWKSRAKFSSMSLSS